MTRTKKAMTPVAMTLSLGLGFATASEVLNTATIATPLGVHQPSSVASADGLYEDIVFEMVSEWQEVTGATDEEAAELYASLVD